MARNGSGVYSLPAGSTVANGDTSDASDINTPLQDIEADMNTPRPVVAGGTGATSASAALVNLGLTATAAEINILDGATVTTAELNVLDGIPGTLTATEIGYLDGVTSPIQTQLNAKQATITTLALANGGTGAALTDPNADRLLFWDDSAGATAFLTPGTGLTITGTTMTASGGLGVSQTWQDMTASRAFGTSYQNTTGGPITFNPRATTTAGSTVQLETSPNNSTWTVVYKVSHNIGSTFTDSSMGTVVVPDTFYYRCQNVAGTNTLTAWMELRP